MVGMCNVTYTMTTLPVDDSDERIYKVMKVVDGFQSGGRDGTMSSSKNGCHFWPPRGTQQLSRIAPPPAGGMCPPSLESSLLIFKNMYIPNI